MNEKSDDYGLWRWPLHFWSSPSVQSEDTLDASETMSDLNTEKESLGQAHADHLTRGHLKGEDLPPNLERGADDTLNGWKNEYSGLVSP